MNVILGSFLYVVICFITIVVLTREAPFSVLPRLITTYAIIGAIVYFLGLFFLFYVPMRIQKKKEEEEKLQRMRKVNRERFARGKHLREKYRKLSLDELIRDAEIIKSDKLILLEMLHGYTPEEAIKLLEAGMKKDQ